MSGNVRKRTFCHIRQTKIQISLRIRAVWSKSSLRAFWIAKAVKFLHADNEGFEQTAWIRRLIWVFVRRTCQKIRFSHVAVQRTVNMINRLSYLAEAFAQIAWVNNEGSDQPPQNVASEQTVSFFTRLAVCFTYICTSTGSPMDFTCQDKTGKELISLNISGKCGRFRCTWHRHRWIHALWIPFLPWKAQIKVIIGIIPSIRRTRLSKQCRLRSDHGAWSWLSPFATPPSSV